jgi:Tfp pilus assembly protein PilN
MIRINLLPLEVRTTERKIDPNYVIAGVGGALVIFLIPFSWVQYSRRKHLQEEQVSLQSELERYKPIVAQVEALESAKAQLQQRKSIIQALENERLRYPYFMEDILKLLPSNVWLTNMATSIPPDGASINVSFDVLALDHYAVADLVSNFETSQIFTDVDLGTISMSGGGTQNQLISCHVNTVYRKGSLNTINAIKKS